MKKEKISREKIAIRIGELFGITDKVIQIKKDGTYHINYLGTKYIVSQGGKYLFILDVNARKTRVLGEIEWKKTMV